MAGQGVVGVESVAGIARSSLPERIVTFGWVPGELLAVLAFPPQFPRTVTDRLSARIASMSHSVLVTGATGFVGSHVAEALVRHGDAVRALPARGPIRLSSNSLAFPSFAATSRTPWRSGRPWKGGCRCPLCREGRRLGSRRRVPQGERGGAPRRYSMPRLASPCTGSFTSARSAFTRPAITTAPTRPNRCPTSTSMATRSRKSRRSGSPCNITASRACRS